MCPTFTEAFYLFFIIKRKGGGWDLLLQLIFSSSTLSLQIMVCQKTAGAGHPLSLKIYRSVLDVRWPCLMCRSVVVPPASPALRHLQVSANQGAPSGCTHLRDWVTSRAWSRGDNSYLNIPDWECDRYHYQKL